MATISQMKAKLQNALDTKLSIGEQVLTDSQKQQVYTNIGIFDLLDEPFQKEILRVCDAVISNTAVDTSDINSDAISTGLKTDIINACDQVIAASN